MELTHGMEILLELNNELRKGWSFLVAAARINKKADFIKNVLTVDEKLLLEDMTAFYRLQRKITPHGKPLLDYSLKWDVKNEQNRIV